MKILLPVIDPVNGLPAARHLARRFLDGERFDLHLLHVRSAFSAPAAETLRAVREILDRHRLPYSVHYRTGGKARAISAAARELGAGRIVMGTAPGWSPRRLVEHDVIEQLAQDAPAPLSVVEGRPASALERWGVAAGMGAAFWVLLEVWTAV